MLRCATGITAKMTRSPLDRDGSGAVTTGILQEGSTTAFIMTEDGFFILQG
jgi:hypothetical protein